MTTKWTGDCCNEGTVSCCPLTGDCNCYPIKDECECEPPKTVSSDGDCCDKDWVPVTEIECEADGLCYVPNDGCPICEVCDTETTDSPEPDDDDDDDDTETEDECIGKPEIDNCMKCDSSTGEYTIPVTCPDCKECKTLEEGGTGQCEQIVPTAEERAEAEKKLKNRGYTHDEQPDCDYTQESLYMSYREAGYCIEGGKYGACLDRAPVLECGNLVRYDKPSYSNRNSVCDGRQAGYKGWRSQGLNGAKSQQLAMLWDGGYISMGQMFYSSMCNLLETDYNNTLSIRTDYCCPYKENVACSASNGISQCCQYAGKLPDDKKIKCYLDNTEIEMSYICCPSESASVVEVMDSDGKGTGSYICCDVGTNATKVEGGNEGEYICCAEGETAWKDSYGKRQCCATDSEVKNMEVDGTVLYQCCKKRGNCLFTVQW